ncbi:MAG: hypothetical protein V9E87_16585 [Gemmatimonadales bacterium]
MPLLITFDISAEYSVVIVLVVEGQDVGEAEHLARRTSTQLVHLAELDVADAVVDVLEADVDVDW